MVLHFMRQRMMAPISHNGSLTAMGKSGGPKPAPMGGRLPWIILWPGAIMGDPTLPGSGGEGGGGVAGGGGVGGWGGTGRGGVASIPGTDGGDTGGGGIDGTGGGGGSQGSGSGQYPTRWYDPESAWSPFTLGPGGPSDVPWWIRHKLGKFSLTPAGTTLGMPTGDPGLPPDGPGPDTGGDGGGGGDSGGSGDDSGLV